MFERFTDSARRVVVLAQEEARLMDHNYIGTEHLLLGLLRNGDDAAAAACESAGLTLAVAQQEVGVQIGRGKQPLRGHIPFTPRAKKCLELALRESLALQHDEISPAHLLLGVIREGHGMGAQVLRKHAGDLDGLQATVLARIAPSARRARIRLPGWPRPVPGREPAAAGAGAGEQEQAVTPAGELSLGELRRLAGPDPVGSHHLLLAALADPASAAARVLAALDVDLDQLKAMAAHVDVAGSSDELPEEAGRRQMLIRVTADRVVVEAADQAVVSLGREVAAALGGGDGTVRGDSTVAGSMAGLWQALHDSLADIRARAGQARSAPAHEQAGPAQDQPPAGAQG